MYAHGAMALLFGGIGLLALWLRRQPPSWRMRLLILLGGAGIIGFGVAIACIDQRITSNITPLLLACFACAMFILIRPAYAVPFYGLAMLAFEVAMDHAQADPQLRLSNQANGLTAFGLGLLLSLILWHGHVRNLRQQRKLELQRQELEEKNRQLEYLAGHDPLTGLFNRREFDQLVLMELARIARQPQPLSLLMVDLDHFKYINDRYGHPSATRSSAMPPTCCAAIPAAATAWRAWAGKNSSCSCPTPPSSRLAALRKNSANASKVPRWRRRTACSA